MLNVRSLAAGTLLLFALFASATHAAPVTLKAAFFSSDRSTLFRAIIKPLVDEINARGKNGIEIVVYAGGVLGRDLKEQSNVVRNGIADIAFVVPGYTPELFPDDAVIELPGLFRDMREGTLAYTRLIAKGALRGYEDFVVLGAFVTQPETIHSRQPVRSLDDLRGKRVRMNNAMEAAALQALGALPVPRELHQVAPSLNEGAIDAALIPLTPLFDYGIKRIAPYHFMLGTSGAPLLVLMNRKKFDSLPAAEQALLRKYSGEWAAERFIEIYDESDLLRQLKAETGRTIIEPSAADLARAQAVFNAVIANWTAESPRHADLLAAVNAELAKLRGQ